MIVDADAHVVETDKLGAIWMAPIKNSARSYLARRQSQHAVLVLRR